MLVFFYGFKQTNIIFSITVQYKLDVDTFTKKIDFKTFHKLYKRGFIISNEGTQQVAFTDGFVKFHGSLHHMTPVQLCNEFINFPFGLRWAGSACSST